MSRRLSGLSNESSGDPRPTHNLDLTVPTAQYFIKEEAWSWCSRYG